MPAWLGHALRVLLVAAGLGYAAWGVDFGLLWTSLRGYAALPLITAQGAVVLVFVFMGLRLKLLATKPVTLGTTTLAALIGQGVNNMAPTRVGELVKAVYLARHGGISRAEALGVVFWERFLDLNALVLLGLIPVLIAGHAAALVPMLALVASIWVGMVALQRWPALLPWLLGALPFERLRAFLLDLSGQIQARARSEFLLRGVASTALLWAAHLLQAALVFWAVAALPLDLVQGLVVFVVAVLGLAVPSTPGGLGVFEAAMVLALGWYGIGREDALATAIVMRMIVFVPVTLLTLVVLARQETGFGELMRGR